METRVKKVLAWVVVLSVTAAYTAGLYLWYDSTYTDLHIKYHSTEVHRIGYYRQGEHVRAIVVFDEGSVKVLEGREVTIYLLDSDNASKLESGGWTPLVRLHIDTDETDMGAMDYTAHADDTYYLVYQNFDFWNLTLRMAAGGALKEQTLIKGLWIGLFATTAVAFAYFYRLLFGVDVRRLLGLTRMGKGPGAIAAREREGQTPATPGTAAGERKG